MTVIFGSFAIAYSFELIKLDRTGTVGMYLTLSAGLIVGVGLSYLLHKR